MPNRGLSRYFARPSLWSRLRVPDFLTREPIQIELESYLERLFRYAKDDDSVAILDFETYESYQKDTPNLLKGKHIHLV
ncbi:MAG: hypothetical protein MAG795_00573 [Candidatus Woesearchaeota archaeon]|nr:hypothetical protein [Candidatus Woesearchaeota archaeon]